MSNRTVTNDKEFKDAVEAKVETIIVRNAELATKLKVIMRIPAASLTAAGAALGIVIFSAATAHTEVVTAPLTGGMSTVLRFGAGAASATAVVALLGTKATIALVAIGVLLGGFGLLKELYTEYKLVESGEGYVILQRK